MEKIQRLLSVVAFAAMATSLLPSCANHAARDGNMNGYPNNTGVSMNVGMQDTNPGYRGITSGTGAGVQGPGTGGAP